MSEEEGGIIVGTVSSSSLFWGYTISFRWVALLTLCAISWGHMMFSRRGKFLRKFPSLSKIPLFGCMLEAPWNVEDFGKKVRKTVVENGRVVAFWVGNIPFVLIACADTSQKVLGYHKQIEKGLVYRQLEWILKKGLVTANGKIWQKDRKLLNPSFKYQRFDGFLEIFNKKAAILSVILQKKFEDNGGKPIHIYEFLIRVTMDTISETVLGVPTNYQQEDKGAFVQALEYVAECIRIRGNKPYLSVFPAIWYNTEYGKKEKIASKVITENTYKTIQKRIEILKEQGEDSIQNEDDREENEKKTKPIIDYLLNAGEFEYILGHVNTIFGAGYDTTATTMNHCLFMLALHPEIQETVHNELDSLFWDDYDRSVGMDDLTELRYLEMCLKETLRLYPPVPVMLRTATEDIPLNETQIIPKDSEIFFPIPELHRDPAHFPDPEKFDPDRFLPDVCAARHPYAWIPFSIGPRNCIGYKYAMMQMKTILAHVLRRFRVTTTTRREDQKLVYGIVLETSPSIEILMIPRRTNPKDEIDMPIGKASSETGFEKEMEIRNRRGEDDSDMKSLN